MFHSPSGDKKDDDYDRCVTPKQFDAIYEWMKVCVQQGFSSNILPPTEMVNDFLMNNIIILCESLFAFH